ncbi:solute carrier family 15 member 2 [Trichonephila clavata]|uniref:Oligopeptide transporter 1 n=1 Tax=Trichonephila clavata TaxID=2740835 RepID=A0A8X6L296_TRICU|nr:solute carrier family 15 member 2 [Trichonephila clavata]
MPKKDKPKDDKKKKKKDDEKKSQDEHSESETDIKKFPRGIFFLLGNEFCERFSFYGMRTILTLFLVNQLHYSENVASKIYHGFQIVAYFMPLFGAIVADAWLGKFWTILSLSIFYACGNLTIAAGAIPNNLTFMRVMSVVGLFIIGTGTGGIKPCVSAFGGDQFKKGQEAMRQHFFGLFYFAINSGSLISTALTPFLREDVKCFGEDSCFSVAFFVPAVLFVIALTFFAIGKPFYVIKSAEGSIFVRVVGCICNALCNKASKKGEKKEHWLDYADDRYDSVLKQDIKRLLRILILYIPLPLFWALYEQQGSKWVIQATEMDGKITRGVHIKPDHMQIINPLLILVMIPIFDFIVYPLFSRIHLLTTPLQKMTVGGLLSAFAFVITAFIQLKIETEIPELPPEGEIEMLVINNSPCTLQMRSPLGRKLQHFGVTSLNIPISKTSDWSFVPEGCDVKREANKSVGSLNETFNAMMVTFDDDKLVIQVSNDTREKHTSGDSQVRLLFSIDYEFIDNENASFLIQGSSTLFLFPDKIIRPGKIGMTEYCSLAPGEYELFLPIDENDHEEEPVGKFEVGTGGSYTIFILQSEARNIRTISSTITVRPNSIHRLWQIPQCIVITAGEVMFSITGLDFSYSQAPASLKSVVQAIWLLTSALGNFIVVLLNFLKFERYSHEFFMYASLMTLSMAAFGIIACFYQYAESEEKS